LKILVIKPSSLGDIVHGLRIVHQVHEILPSVRIDWVVKKGLEDILFASGFIEKIYLFERGEGFTNYCNLIKEIRGEKYDYVLDLQGLLRSAVLLKFAHSKEKLGVADGRELSTLLYTSVGEKSRKAQTHALDRLVPFLDKLGIHNFDRNLSLNFPKSKVSENTQKVLGEKKFVLLFPESRRKEKVWPFFKELTESFERTRSVNFVISGNNPDHNYPFAIDLRGRVELEELPALINRAHLVVSNDSAPLHIASALRKPLIALFGPTSAKRYGAYPLNSMWSIVLSAIDGRMGSITISDVEQQISKLLFKIP